MYVSTWNSFCILRISKRIIFKGLIEKRHFKILLRYYNSFCHITCICQHVLFLYAPIMFILGRDINTFRNLFNQYYSFKDWSKFIYTYDVLSMTFRIYRYCRIYKQRSVSVCFFSKTYTSKRCECKNLIILQMYTFTKKISDFIIRILTDLDSPNITRYIP